MVVHPSYTANLINYEKYRLTFKGGEDFINRYLRKFSNKETEEDFNLRRQRTYCPAFAKAAILEIKNAISSSFCNIIRYGGTESYKESVLNNIDGRGRSLDWFMSEKVLPELLSMGSVGIYVDMPPISDSSDLTEKIKPYIYTYPVESIKNWNFNHNTGFKSIVLEDSWFSFDELGLPNNIIKGHRTIWKDGSGVYIKRTDSNEGVIDQIKLNLTDIPFILLRLSNSLLLDIADYQIALLNLASSDINFALQANFPFYVEPYTVLSEYSDRGKEDKTPSIGITTGRRYPQGSNSPEFIAPPVDNFRASMEKQEQLKREIRLLLSMNISNLKQQWSSADSKSKDEESQNNGLVIIGRELERAERLIAKFWTQYENSDNDTTIIYPNDYDLEDYAEELDISRQLSDLMHKIPSLEFQKRVAAIISRKLLANHYNIDELQLVQDEIMKLKSINGDSLTIKTDYELGLVSTELASELRGYPKGEVAKAKVDHAERLTRIAISQTEGLGKARGLPDMETEQNPLKDGGRPSNAAGTG